MNGNAATPFARKDVGWRGSASTEVAMRDLTWESELLSLLCVLEMARTHLQEACRNNQAVPALDEMLALSGHLRDFLDARPELLEETAVAEVRLQIEAFNARTLRLRNRLYRSAWQQLLRLFQGELEHGNPHHQFVTCARDVHGVLTEAFELFARLFVSSRAATDWKEAGQMFLADLQKLVEELQN